MTITKRSLAKKISGLGYSEKKSLLFIEIIITKIKDSLISGEDVIIPDFGNFCVRKKASRVGRNPATGGALKIDSRRVIIFRYSRILKQRCGNPTKNTQEQTITKKYAIDPGEYTINEIATELNMSYTFIIEVIKKEKFIEKQLCREYPYRKNILLINKEGFEFLKNLQSLNLK